MATAKVQKAIIDALRSAETDLSLNELVARVRPDASGRGEVKAAVVPLLYRQKVSLTPRRKFRIAS